MRYLFPQVQKHPRDSLFFSNTTLPDSWGKNIQKYWLVRLSAHLAPQKHTHFEPPAVLTCKSHRECHSLWWQVPSHWLIQPPMMQPPIHHALLNMQSWQTAKAAGQWRCHQATNRWAAFWVACVDFSSTSRRRHWVSLWHLREWGFLFPHCFLFSRLKERIPDMRAPPAHARTHTNT